MRVVLVLFLVSFIGCFSSNHKIDGFLVHQCYRICEKNDGVDYLKICVDALSWCIDVCKCRNGYSINKFEIGKKASKKREQENGD